MTSRYITDALERCRLPVSVRIRDWRDCGVLYQFNVEALDLSPFGPDDIVLTVTPDWRDATSAYFELVASLETESASSPWGGAAVVLPSSPEGGM